MTFLCFQKKTIHPSQDINDSPKHLLNSKELWFKSIKEQYFQAFPVFINYWNNDLWSYQMSSINLKLVDMLSITIL